MSQLNLPQVNYARCYTKEITSSLSATGIGMVSGVARVKSMGSSSSSSAIMYRRSESRCNAEQKLRKGCCFGNGLGPFFLNFTRVLQYLIKQREQCETHSLTSSLICSPFGAAEPLIRLLLRPPRTVSSRLRRRPIWNPEECLCQFDLFTVDTLPII